MKHVLEQCKRFMKAIAWILVANYVSFFGKIFEKLFGTESEITIKYYIMTLESSLKALNYLEEINENMKHGWSFELGLKIGFKKAFTETYLEIAKDMLAKRAG